MYVEGLADVAPPFPGPEARLRSRPSPPTQQVGDQTTFGAQRCGPHGGAGEQCVALYEAVAARWGDATDEASLKASVSAEMDAQHAAGVTHLPGFGHRFHPVDPRAPRLLALVDEACAQGVVSGRYAAIARALESCIAERRGGRRVPMNIDGATAVIFAELGFAPTLCRGLFIISRSVGALAHAWEESQSGARNKGPIPRDLIPEYDGPAPRKLPPDYIG